MTEMAMPTSLDRVEVWDFHREVYTIETGYGYDANGERCQWWRYVIDPLHEERVVSVPFTSIQDCMRGAKFACELLANGASQAPTESRPKPLPAFIDDAPAQPSGESEAQRRQMARDWMEVTTSQPRWLKGCGAEFEATGESRVAFHRYDAAVARTMATAPGDTSALAHWALGLAGEAGEVCEPIKKHCFNGRDLDRDALAAELGDVLWYLSALAQSIGSSLAEVAARNVAKLEARYPDGYVPGGGKR